MLPPKNILPITSFNDLNLYAPSFGKAFLGTGQNLFYNMAGAKRNWATTFFELIQNGINNFYKVNL